ncbi:ER lumen protein-retaining receptor [Fasciolopsis buskii]|uniref:ER lumen protein-retaining receptor n=1 Tax=Fasciolopsis buskii TaxID=27845 RepID=A0A8E0RX55_9TREM|nr:ER lumen protein-retaining receptor [Fasciolopsis buski]
MNIFRMLGDFCHLLAIFILLKKIWKTRSCSGLSGKSQLLFAIVFITRYLDLFFAHISIYNTVMKLIFIVSSCLTVFLIHVKFRATYNSNHDTFKVLILIIPSLLLALIANYAMSVTEILWAFSIYLEAVAIMPQLFMISKTGEAETITSHYLFALGAYRALYLLNWAYRYYFEGHMDHIALIAGAVQTLLYCDFFYLYFTRVLKGRALRLPA